MREVRWVRRAVRVRFTSAPDDGIVVREVREAAVMEVADVAPALQERLGPEATAALVDLFDIARREWTAEVTTVAVERFERRLSEEVGTLRAEIRSVDANLRLDMANGFAAVRQDMASAFAAVRQEMGALRQDQLAGRFELLKWCFAFWIGQIVAVATIVGVMLRTMPRT